MEKEVIYESKGRLRSEGKPNDITVKDKDGNVLGHYTGYYYPSRRSVTLYPKAQGIGATGYDLHKHSVSDTLIRINERR